MEAQSLWDDFKSMVRLAVPVVVGQLATIGMQTTDIALVGHYDSSLMGGMALGHTIYATLLLVGMGVIQGISPVIAQAYGAGDKTGCGRALGQGLYLALGVGIVMTISLQWGEGILLLTGQDPLQAHIAQRYLTTLSGCCVPFFLFLALRQLVEGVSQMRPVMVVSILGLLVNAVVCYGLVYGALGLPALGLEGAGVATTLTSLVCVIALAVYSLSSTQLRSLALLEGLTGPDWTEIRQLLRVGLPIAVSMGMEVGAFSAAALLMGWFGPISMGAHQVALNLASTTFMIPLGISIAGSVRVGQAAGQGHWQGVRRAGWMTFGMAGGVMLINAGLFLAVPRLLVSIYTTDAAIVATGMQLLKVAAAFQLFDGLQVAGMGVLRGLKDTRVPMLATTLAYWGVGMPSSYALGMWTGWGPLGIWIGLSLGLVTAAGCHLARFYWLTRSGNMGRG